RPPLSPLFPYTTLFRSGLDYKLSGHPHLPRGALSQGADLAIGSVHKTLTGLSQTSVLSVGSDLIDTERLQLCFELEESTSASALDRKSTRLNSSHVSIS